MALSTLALLMLAADLHGYISDSACGWNNARPGKEAKDCAEMCVKAGWPPVFVRDGGMDVFKIVSAADRQKVRAFVGEHVTIAGEIKGDELRLTAIRKSPDPRPAKK